MTAQDDRNNARTVQWLKDVTELMRTIPERIAQAYVGEAPGQQVGIIDDRFKGRGNKRFAPLAASTQEAKTKSLSSRRSSMRRSGRTVGRGDAILVSSGKLRSAVNNLQSIEVRGIDETKAVIVFRGLPPYAAYHETGAGSLPVRSPVQPNSDDLDRVAEVMSRVLDVASGSPSGAARVLNQRG